MDHVFGSIFFYSHGLPTSHMDHYIRIDPGRVGSECGKVCRVRSGTLGISTGYGKLNVFVNICTALCLKFY